MNTARFFLSRRGVVGLGALLLASRLSSSKIERKPVKKWAVDYSANTPPQLAQMYDLLVLEPDHARSIEPLRNTSSILLGYVSLGEVHRSRPYFTMLQARDVFFEANPNWPDALFADLRKPAWRQALLDDIIPAILSKGYNGIFIDTTDNAEAMELADPLGNHGMVQAAIDIIIAVRTRFPSIKIMLNRGYAALPAVAPHIDYALGEAMASRWSFSAKRYEHLSNSDWEWQANKLRAAKAINPSLALMTLDYWDPRDTATLRTLYANERTAGFLPYVSTLQLDKLVTEPKP